MRPPKPIQHKTLSKYITLWQNATVFKSIIKHFVLKTQGVTCMYVNIAANISSTPKYMQKLPLGVDYPVTRTELSNDSRPDVPPSLCRASSWIANQSKYAGRIWFLRETRATGPHIQHYAVTSRDNGSESIMLHPLPPNLPCARSPARISLQIFTPADVGTFSWREKRRQLLGVIN